MLRWALIGLLILHGLIHLMGFAKAFGYAELPQLTQPISRDWGVVWLLAGGLVVAGTDTDSRNLSAVAAVTGGASNVACCPVARRAAPVPSVADVHVTAGPAVCSHE